MAVSKGFNQWALVELMGHQRIAGKVTEEEIAGATLLRVDVPGTATKQPLTKYFGPSAIYAITPLSEETCRAASARISSEPISEWDAERLVKLIAEGKRLGVPRSGTGYGYPDDETEADERNEDL